MPPKEKSFDVFKMTYYVSQDGGVRRSNLRNFEKKNSRVVEKLRSFHMLHPDVFACYLPEICCCGMVFVNRGQVANILLRKCWHKNICL